MGMRRECRTQIGRLSFYYIQVPYEVTVSFSIVLPPTESLVRSAFSAMKIPNDKRVPGYVSSCHVVQQLGDTSDANLREDLLV